MPGQLLKSERNIIQKLPLALHNAEETKSAEHLKISGKLTAVNFLMKARLRDTLELPG